MSHWEVRWNSKGGRNCWRSQSWDVGPACPRPNLKVAQVVLMVKTQKDPPVALARRGEEQARWTWNLLFTKGLPSGGKAASSPQLGWPFCRPAPLTSVSHSRVYNKNKTSQEVRASKKWGALLQGKAGWGRAETLMKVTALRHGPPGPWRFLPLSRTFSQPLCYHPSLGSSMKWCFISTGATRQSLRII